MELRFEVLDDYDRYCNEILSDFYVDYEPGNDDPGFLLQKLTTRLILPQPRTVYEAADLEIPPQFQAAYEEIRSDLETGKLMKKYQSRLLKKQDINDDLLSHWGIHHLHLGREIDTDGFVKRTGELLFIHHDDHAARILGIFDHSSWCNEDLLQIINRNWPEVLEKHRLKGITGGVFTEEQLKNLRKKNVNVSLAIGDDSNALFGPGMGVVCSGEPLSAILSHQQHSWYLQEHIGTITENIDEILRATGHTPPPEILTVGLKTEQSFINNPEGKLIFYFKETGIAFSLQGLEH